MHILFIMLLTFYFVQHVTLSYNSKYNASHRSYSKTFTQGKDVFDQLKSYLLLDY